MKILGIETTCDETACAVVEDGYKILSNVLSTQIEQHQPYGGVYPELASRLHVDRLIPLIELALKEANLEKKDIDAIAVSYAPGLIGAITIGLSAAKALSQALGIPFIGVNHVEAHLYAAMMNNQTIQLPGLGLVLSGGHTFMVKVTRLGEYEMISQTVDDSVGEAFDKVARMLDLPYPGGPEIEKLALKGNPEAFPLKAGTVKKNPLAFSLSGLKTNVLYTIQRLQKTSFTENQKNDLAASFQKVVFEDIAKKTSLALSHFEANSILLGGGVTQNLALQTFFNETFGSDYELYFPPKGLSVDNAAMIAGLGYHKLKQQKISDPLDLKAHPRISLA